MKRMACMITVAAVALALSGGAVLAHGGSYTGPAGGGTPGYTGPTGGGTITPGSGAGPQGPGGTTPNTGGGGTTGPNLPGGTGPSRVGGRATNTKGGAGRGGRGGRTGGRGKKVNVNARFNAWDWWWSLNQQRFLNLKNHVRSTAKASDNSDLFLGGEKGGDDDVAEVTLKDIRNHILPILKQAVKDKFFDARSGALIALGKVGDASQNDIVDLIEGYLGDTNKQVRESCCLALGILGSKKTIPLLMSIVKNTPSARKLMKRGGSDILNRTRAFAAVGIGLIGSRGKFDDEQSSKIIDELLALTRVKIKGDKDVAVGPALALGLIKNDKAIPQIVEIFKDRNIDDYVRAHMGVALGKLGARSAKKALLRGLEAKDVHVRRSSAIALGLVVSPDDIKTVKKLRQQAKGAADRATRNFCIIALGDISSKESRQTLVEMVARGKNAYDRTFAAVALGVAGFGKDADWKGEVAQVLLKRWKSTKSSSERGAYAVGMGLLEYTPAQAELEKVFKEKGQFRLKGHVCTALGLMNDKNAIPEIQKLVKQRSDTDMRKAAAIALGLLKDPDAIGTLEDVIKSNVKSQAILGAATVALGYVGDRRAVPVLSKMLGHDAGGIPNARDVTRAFATVALGFLGDKDPIPMLSLVQENSNYLAQTNAIVELLTIL